MGRWGNGEIQLIPQNRSDLGVRFDKLTALSLPKGSRTLGRTLTLTAEALKPQHPNTPTPFLTFYFKNMEVQFREFNPFDVWFWLEFSTVPSNMEQQYVEEVFSSWFYLGKLGAFNAENLQVQEVGVDISYMEYDTDIVENAFMSPMHNMTDFEYLGTWGRCWFDLGTSDPIALDILINALTQLSKDFVDIKRLIIGGENEDWPVSDRSNYLFSE